MSETAVQQRVLRALIVAESDDLAPLVDLLEPCGILAEVVDRDGIGIDDSPALAVIEARGAEPATVDLVRRLRGDGARVVLQAGHSGPGEVCDLYRAGADVVFGGEPDPYHLFLQCCSLLQIWHPDARPARVGRARFDAANRRLVAEDGSVRLTEAESRILGLLIDGRSGFVSRDAISRSVFRIPYDRFDRRIDVHVSNLRKKLRENAIGASIDTSRLHGFRLVSEAGAAHGGAVAATA